ncbi:hypothetical protein BGX21_004830 [Mortierella sp. AD011]|nr:hypothetical protein BGX21_004830 [Mortierella sp. AD011]
MGKKVLRTMEHDKKVTVYCSDNTIYKCSILVGADGAYSAVRQNIYQQLVEKDSLPPGDNEAFSIGYITMVGVSSPTDHEKYPELRDDSRAYFRLVIGENNDSLPEDKAKEQHFTNSEWEPESVEAMLKVFQDFPCAFGGTMKDIFDATPKELISKVFLEEKLFQTWYHGRSVLIGDACHKFLPGAGQGAVMAMKDAVVLANCLYNMKDVSDESIETAFANYYRQRYFEANAVLKSGVIYSKIMFGHKWIDRLLRKIVFNCLPGWLRMKEVNNGLANRPQINWLPLVENRGSGKVLPQEGREEAEKKARSVWEG